MKVITLNNFPKGDAMKLPKRARYAILALLMLTGFLLLTVRGPVLTDGVAFYSPIMICAFLAWRFIAFRKNRARSYTFLTGAAGGLVGTLVWPTGILVGMMITGTADPKTMPLVMLFAIFFVASVLGGAVAMILSLGFDGKLEQVEPQPAPNQNEPTAEQIPIPNAV